MVNHLSISSTIGSIFWPLNIYWLQNYEPQSNLNTYWFHKQPHGKQKELSIFKANNLE
jgi:hypothetical protein